MRLMLNNYNVSKSDNGSMLEIFNVEDIFDLFIYDYKIISVDLIFLKLKIFHERFTQIIT